jgi:hypothetical protein
MSTGKSCISGASRGKLELEFAEYQMLDTVPVNDRIDLVWVAIGAMKDATGEPMFENLPRVMLGILTIPHSNAQCERIFSCVRANKTYVRNLLGTVTLDAIMVMKSTEGEAHEKKYSTEKLQNLKSAYYNSLKK